MFTSTIKYSPIQAYGLYWVDTMSLEDYQRKLAYILYPTVFKERDEYKDFINQI
jgi:hypothetical protein